MQELEHLVEAGGIRIPFEDDRKEFVQIVAEQIRFTQRLACAHPVHITAQGVDLAIVGDIAKRLRERP